MTENCPHYTIEMECRECFHDWIAVSPVVSGDCFPLDCPNCGEKNWTVAPSPPVHLVVSQMNGAAWIKPSRPVPQWKLVAMLVKALAMVNESTDGVITPESCELQAFLTVDDSQVPDRG